MTSQASILLLGGGYALQRVAEKLPADSFVITSRSAEKREAWRAKGFAAELVDVEDKRALKALFSAYPEITTIVDSVPPALRSREGSLQDATQGVRYVCECAPGSVSRIIYLSTTGVFGVEDGSWIDEKSPASPKHIRASARYESEAAYRSTGKAVSAFRISGIYGPGRGIGLSLKNGSYRLIEYGARWSNRIHVEDLASAIVNAVNKDLADPLPEVLCVSDDKPSLSSDVVAFYCSKFDLPTPGSISAAEALRQGLHTMLSNQRVKNDLLKRTLLPALRYPSYMEGAGTEF